MVGVQRPLRDIAEIVKTVYLPRGINVEALDKKQMWGFTPKNFKVGDQITGGDIFGEVVENVQGPWAGQVQLGRSCPTPPVPFPGPRPAVQANRVPVPADWCVPYAPPPAPTEDAALTLLTTNGPEHSSQGLYINQYYKTKRSTSWTSLIWCET